MPVIFGAPQYRKIKSVSISPTAEQNHSAGSNGNVSVGLTLVSFDSDTASITLKATLGVTYGFLGNSGSDSATFTVKISS